MGRKRPCSICRRWFEPDPRTAKKQKVCSKDDCQRRRHARACARWRAGNPDYDIERRVRALVVAELPEVPAAPVSDPRDGLRWDRARDVMGAKGTVVAYELTGLIVQWTRDAMRPKMGERPSESLGVPRPGPRDVTDARGPAP